MESPATASHSVRISISPMLVVVDCLRIDKNVGLVGVLFESCISSPNAGVLIILFDEVIFLLCCDCSRVYLFS